MGTVAASEQGERDSLQERYGRTFWGDTNIFYLDRGMTYVGLSVSQDYTVKISTF